MKKISSVIFIVLLTNLLSGCGFYSDSNNQEIPNEPIKQEVEVEPEIKIDTGTYQGQVDNNFIEIAISGIPEEKAMRVFMLSDEAKDQFPEVEISGGEVIKIKYFINENEQNVIVEIEKLD